MKSLKGVGLGLLGFLLFLALSIFGWALTLNSTLLDSDFVTSQLDKLDVAVLAEEFISEQEDEEAVSEELETALVDTITELAPVIKEGIGDTIEPVYDYLQGKSESIDLAQIIARTDDKRRTNCRRRPHIGLPGGGKPERKHRNLPGTNSRRISRHPERNLIRITTGRACRVTSLRARAVF